MKNDPSGVNDVDRPDINNPPKMAAIKDQAKLLLNGSVPYLHFLCDDNLMSNVTIRGALEPKEKWSSGIFHNASYFILHIEPMNGKRYYNPADPSITVEVISCNNMPKFRKYTGPVEKVLAKVKAWIEQGKQEAAAKAQG